MYLHYYHHTHTYADSTAHIYVLSKYFFKQLDTHGTLAPHNREGQATLDHQVSDIHSDLPIHSCLAR